MRVDVCVSVDGTHRESSQVTVQGLILEESRGREHGLELATGNEDTSPVFKKYKIKHRHC